jgi:mercuric reductase
MRLEGASLAFHSKGAGPAIVPSRRTFDLAVLGGGSAGFAAAIRGAELGARVVVVESGPLGGTCVNVGCLPSKTLIRAAEVQYRRSHHPFDGIPKGDGAPDWSLVRAQKDRLVAELRHEKYASVLEAYQNILLVRGRGRLESPTRIALDDGARIEAGTIVIATGASPSTPGIAGLEQAGYLDSTSAMALERLPASLGVLGGGAVGLELAQMFARLGVQVRVLEALPRVLPAEDPEIGSRIAHYLGNEGLELLTGVRVESVKARSGSLEVLFRDGDTVGRVHVERLLVATGRRPNTAGLGLEAVGIALGPKGEIAVDEYLQTSLPSVYAAGDVVGEPMFVYVAAYAGGLAAENALAGRRRRYDLSAVPRVTFTDPAVASVGLTEDAARAAGIEPLVSTLPLALLPRARAQHDLRGFIKLLADARTQKIVGAHILAAEAGEIVTEATLAVRLGLTFQELSATFHPYLTLSEGMKLAAQGFSKDLSKLSCCA